MREFAERYGQERDEAHQMAHENPRLVLAAEDLLEALLVALPFVENAEKDQSFKAGMVKKHVRAIRAAIAKAGAA